MRADSVSVGRADSGRTGFVRFFGEFSETAGKKGKQMADRDGLVVLYSQENVIAGVSVSV